MTTTGCPTHMRPAYARRMCDPLVHGRTDGRTDADASVTLHRSLAFSDAHAQARGIDLDLTDHETTPEQVAA